MKSIHIHLNTLTLFYNESIHHQAVKRYTIISLILGFIHVELHL